MSNNINVLDLILHASLPVQLVMVLLVIASISSWVIILMKKRVLDRAYKGADDFEERFWSGTDMSALMRELGNQDERATGLLSIFEAGFREFARLRQKKSMDNRTQLEGAQRAMRTALSREMDALEHNLEYLANVGSISPYVGLFGTVWGIMNTFTAIAIRHDTSPRRGACDARDARRRWCCRRRRERPRPGGPGRHAPWLRGTAA